MIKHAKRQTGIANVSNPSESQLIKCPVISSEFPEKQSAEMKIGINNLLGLSKFYVQSEVLLL